MYSVAVKVKEMDHFMCLNKGSITTLLVAHVSNDWNGYNFLKVVALSSAVSV